MYLLNGMTASRMEEVTFSDLQMMEDQVEEILRKNIDMICGDEESMLLVGQQAANRAQARCDLIAVDQEGNLVLIELKRDRQDMRRRPEPLEFQAIRYAASCAAIQTTDELIQNIFAPYIEKHQAEFDCGGLSSVEAARRRLESFLEANHAAKFNEHQRIVLVASDFDQQTLAAVAWLNSSQVDISCYKIVPYRMEGRIFLDPQKVLPLQEYEDFYISFKEKMPLEKRRRRGARRRVLPQIDSLLEWGVVKAGDVLMVKERSDEAVLRSDGLVDTPEGGTLSLQQWLKSVLGWSQVATYDRTVEKASGKTLSELRQDYMERMAREAVEEAAGEPTEALDGEVET